MPADAYKVSELFQFVVGSETQYYTSAESTVTFEGNDYLPRSLKASPLSSSADQAKNELTIEAPGDFEIAQLFRYTPPATVVLVRMYRYNEGNLGLAELVWPGRLLSVEWEEKQDEDTVTLQCEPISVSLTRNGLRRRFSKQCPYVLFDAKTCKVDKSAYEHVTTVVGATGITLYVTSTNANHQYPGGYGEWVRPTHTERRFIEAASNQTLTLFQPFTGISEGDTISLYPGCPHTIQACNVLYGNEINYGGFPYMKTENIFVDGLNINPTISNYQQPSIPIISITSIMR